MFGPGRTILDALRSPDERKWLFISFSVYTLGLYLYMVITNFMMSTSWANEVNKMPPLLDLGHEATPYVGYGLVFTFVNFLPYVSTLMGPVYLFVRGESREVAVVGCLMGVLKLIKQHHAGEHNPARVGPTVLRALRLAT